MRVSETGRAVVTTVTLLAAAAPVHAQVTGAVDVGVSSVQYEGYLASGAAYLNPTFRYDTPDASVGLQGSGVLFETGSHIVQATVAGAWRTPRYGRWHAEVSGSGGVTSYTTDEAAYPVYGHALGRLRAHYATTHSGGWVGAATGQSFFGAVSDAPIEIGGGVWFAGSHVAASGTVLQTWLADSSYIDFTASVRWVHDRFEWTGTAGVRTASTGGGSGAWAEGSLMVPVAGPVAALIAGGRYPSDPVRGLLSATYVTAGLRVTAIGRHPKRGPSPPDRATSTGPDVPRLTVEKLPRDSVALVIAAPEAGRVEIAGDFTDWIPVSLDRTAAGTWTMRTALDPGIYRLNLRVDGGPWMVPPGFASLADDFGGSVALLVIP